MADESKPMADESKRAKGATERDVWYTCFIAALTGSAAKRSEFSQQNLVQWAAEIADAALEEFRRRRPKGRTGAFVA